MASKGRNTHGALARLTKSKNPLVRATVDIGHVAGQLFVCIGPWFIGIRRLP
jgi:hypothetical protein